MANSCDRLILGMSVFLCTTGLASAPANAQSQKLPQAKRYVPAHPAKESGQKPLPPMPHLVQPPVKRVTKQLQPSAPMELVETGDKSGVRLYQAIVVQSKQEMDSLWSRHKPGVAAPDVDFDKYTVLAVFDGQKNVAGYQLQILAVRKTDSGAKVSYRVLKPTKGKPSVTTGTQPYQIVKTAKIDGTIAFRAE